MKGKHALDDWRIVLGIFVVLSALFLAGFMRHPTWLASDDWDQTFFWYESARRTVVEYHQMPLWNPFYCGGNPSLELPAFSYLSPAFLIVLLFGTVVGLKLNILLHLVLGMMGCWLLARELKVRAVSRLMLPVVFMLSSPFALHISVGHADYMAMAWVPFVFLFYLKARQHIRWAIPAGISLLLILLEANQYLFVIIWIMVVVYAIFESMKKLDLEAIGVVAIMFAICFGVGAIKLVPAAHFLSEHPTEYDYLEFGSESYTFMSLTSSLLSSDMSDIPGMTWGAHEYRAYVGVVPLALAFRGGPLDLPLAGAGLVMLWLGFGPNAPIDLLAVVQKIPVVGSMHVPTRYIIPVVFVIAVLSALGLSKFEKKRRWLAWASVLFVVANMLLVSVPVMQNVFSIPPFEVEASGFRQVHVVWTDNLAHSQYRQLLQNKGITNCYESVKLPIKAVYSQKIEAHCVQRAGKTYCAEEAKQNPDYRGEAYLLGGEGAGIARFSPNEIVVKANPEAPTRLVLNQNYAEGWKSDAGEVEEYEGRVSVWIEPNINEVRFAYRPQSFFVGLVITLCSIAVLCYFAKGLYWGKG